MTDIIKAQQGLARKAQTNQEHQFEHLYFLMCKREWIGEALQKVLTNAGAYTPGIDGISFKDFNDLEKSDLENDKFREQFMVELQAELKTQRFKPLPVRRVEIPKPGTDKKRPLGIMTIKDRVVQTLLKMVLEPIWEADFMYFSNGFRPTRCTMDCIEPLYSLFNKHQRYRWVIEGDLKACFDNISIEFLLETIGNVPGIQLIKQWLKAGYIEKDVFHQTEAGTPQGGVISPLLANIALHGMEEALGVKYGWNGCLRAKRAVVRYADDFCVFCESQQDAEEAKEILEKWLKTRGLSFSSEKTQIVHISQGFNFVGFNIRHYRSKKTKTGWKLLTKPSKQSVQKHQERLREEWQALVGRSLKEVIVKLNPIIRGGANSAIRSLETISNNRG